MNLKKSDAFKSEAVQLAQHKHDDLMSGPHDDVHKELARLRKENRILKEEREILKKATLSSSRLAGVFASQKR